MQPNFGSFVPILLAVGRWSCDFALTAYKWCNLLRPQYRFWHVDRECGVLHHYTALDVAVDLNDG